MFMLIGVIGINYKSSDLTTREHVARAVLRCFEDSGKESYSYAWVLLSTCNRTEIYFSAEDLPAAHGDILSALRLERGEESFEHHLYSYFGPECFAHLALVTAGLDSALLGESEIQRQVKDAYEKAALDRSLPHVLHFLFQKALKLGKWVRTQNFFPQCREGVEKQIHLLMSSLFNQNRIKLFFFGNSEINRKIMDYLHHNWQPEMTLCTRSLSAATPLEEKYSAYLVDWSEMESWHTHDVVICGTNHHNYLIKALPEKNSVRLIVDLSVPRSVDPLLKRHGGVLLLNSEDLQSRSQESKRHALEQKERVEELVRSAVHRQCALFYQREEVCRAS